MQNSKTPFDDSKLHLGNENVIENLLNLEGSLRPGADVPFSPSDQTMKQQKHIQSDVSGIAIPQVLQEGLEGFQSVVPATKL